MQIITYQELQKLEKVLPRSFISKIKFPVKVRDIHKIEKNDPVDISFFDYENKEKHPIYVSKNVVKKNMLIYY